MAEDPTLADLLASPTSDEVKELLLSFLAAGTYPVTDWHVGGVARTHLELETLIIEDLISQSIPQLAEGGYLDTSTGDWLTLLARGWYARERGRGTVAIQTITLACASGHGPHVITAGNVFFRATDGARYTASTGGTLSSGGTLSIDVTAESPSTAHGLVNALATPMSGVTVTAAAFKIITGETQFGGDDEGDLALIERCAERWPDPAAVPETDRVVVWAQEASDEITRVRLDADEVNPGGVILTVAGSQAPVSGGAVTAAQAAIDERAPVTDFITVQNASIATIVAGGTARVPAARADEIAAAAAEAWLEYGGQVQIGDKVSLSQLVRVIMAAGAIEFSFWELNGAGTDVDLADDEIPVMGDLEDEITWELV